MMNTLELMQYYFMFISQIGFFIVYNKRKQKPKTVKLFGFFEFDKKCEADNEKWKMNFDHF